MDVWRGGTVCLRGNGVRWKEKIEYGGRRSVCGGEDIGGVARRALWK